MIESGQAFFVQGNSTGGSIVLHESSKRGGSTGLGFRPAPSSIAKLESRVYNEDGTTMRDANSIVFNETYNNNIDAEDAPKIGNPGENFALETGSKILAVKGRKPLKDADVIQFRMWNLKQQQYIELDAMRVNTGGLSAMLEDSYLKISNPVHLAGTTTLRFSVDADPAAAAANRFRLVFKKTMINEKPFVKVYPNPAEGNTINLQFTNEPAGRYTIRLLNAAGLSILSKSIAHPGGSCNQSFNLPANIASGAYEVEIIDPNKEKGTQILLVNKQ